jgi:hypothetical protein
MGIATVLVVRGVVPLAVLRWPFAGSLLTLAADACDLIVFNLFGFPDGVSYQRFDKWLDVYYVSLQAVVAWSWSGPARPAAIGLYVYRMVGVGIFEITGWRQALFVFPNLFTFFFVFKAGLDRWRPKYALTHKRLSVWLIILLVPTMALEYTLHYARWLDDVNLFDAVENAAGWLTPGR